MITIDESSPVPVFDQICHQLDGLIRTGLLPAEHKLPSVRQLAADLQIAPGTVLRAYAELDTKGLIETRRGRAARVKPHQQVPADVVAAARALADAAHANRIDLTSALGAVRALWDKGSSSATLF
ncbi:GntR family transcriptional regulator [Luethyella okanaganae]|uniref:GntR family transcriptional regulator n=1 Tax=Luethyella okanaganae TaxID=69372 RepID=A0ABW1VFA5_9MICO